MGIDPRQLRDYIVRPTLEDADLWSLCAEKLILGTCAQESRMGHYIHQLGKGPALGIFQMEPSTHDDIWKNYIMYHNEYVKRFKTKVFVSERLIYDLKYATLMTRFHYLRVSEALPNPHDIGNIAQYWKKYYNTNLGAGSEEEFVQNYNKYVANIY